MGILKRMRRAVARREDADDKDRWRIRCGAHGARRRAYITCLHVIADKGDPVAIAVLEPPEEGGAPGTCICAVCAERDDAARLDELRLVCEDCIPRVVARAGKVGPIP